MAKIGYPVFEGGMTLTKDDLNMLREFLDAQDRVLGRLVGFGIACGLDVTLKGAELTVAPGLAVDQAGRGMLVEEPLPVSVTQLSDEKFAFVDPQQKGVTPVLVVRETEQPAPECADDTCEPHAPLRERSVEVVVVRGRLRTGQAKFALEPLLDVQVLTVDSKSGELVGSLADLRDVILKRLDEEKVGLSPDARKTLTDLKATGTNALKTYRAAFLNQVLFATIELLRCRALHEGTCPRDEPVPGVALGWLDANGVWRCQYGHRFAPNEGLVSALVGGSCGDPCGLALDRLEGLLTTYTEPAEVPPSGGGGGGGRPWPWPPRGGGFEVCGPKKKYGPMVFDACDLEILPAEAFDLGRLKDFWEERRPLIPEKDLPRPSDVFGGDPIDPFKAGTLGLGPAFGGPADKVKEALEGLLGGHVTTPDVRIVTAEEAVNLDGFQPQVSAAVGDTVVLVRNAANVVIGTGRVSAQHVVRNVGAAVQTAQNVAAEAASAVATMHDDVQATITSRLAGVETLLDTAITQKLEILRGEFVTIKDVRAEISGFADRLGEIADVKDRLAAMEDIRKEVQLNIDAVKSLTEQQAKTDIRVDSAILAIGKQPVAVMPAGKEVAPSPVAVPLPEAQSPELLAVIGSLKEAVSAAATKTQAPVVEERLAKTDEALTALVETRAAPVTGVEGAALVKVFENLADAAAGAGAPAARIKAVRRDIDQLKGTIR